MTTDMFDFEKSKQAEIVVTCVIHVVDPEDQFKQFTGFIETEDGLLLPEEFLGDVHASDQAGNICYKYTRINARWTRKRFIAFYDSLGIEEERKIRLVYLFELPVRNRFVSNKNKELVWKTYDEVARSDKRPVGDHHRIFTATFNQ